MRPLTGKYVKVVLLLWIQLAVYSCSFAKSTQNMNTLCPPNFKPLNVESLSNCSIKLSNDSNNFEYALRNRISWEDGTIQRINTDMRIPKDYKTNKYHKMILPNKWLLAYIDPDGPFNFVSWSSDFKVLSLGLLSDDNNEPIAVKINETAGDCEGEIGGNFMITKIVKLFTDFIREKVELDRQYEYENIYLCHLSKFKWFRESRLYMAKRLFGIPFQEFGYKCCMVRKDTVCCDDKLHRIEGYRLLPYIISIFFVLYSPILLVFFAYSFTREENNKFQRGDLTTSIDGHLTQDSNQIRNSSKIISVFLRFPFLVRFFDDQDIRNIREHDKCLDFSCCSDCSCNWDCYCPLLFRRLKRIIFFFLFPSMIYFEFILLTSFNEWKELLKKIGEDDLLFGFPSILGSVKNTMFLPPEGPLGALIIYHIFGFCIIVLPDDFEKSVLEKGISECLANTVNILAPKGFKNEPGRGYYKIRQILQTFMYLPLNAVYWITGRGFLMKVCRFILCPVLAVPIIPFSVITLNGWLQYSCNRLDSCWLFECMTSWSTKISKCIALIISFFAFIIFYGICVVMLSYSIYLMLYIFFFTSLAFIISPTNKSKILIFIIGAILFVYQILRDAIHFYKELFHLIIEICENDDSLKVKYMIHNGQGQFINEKLVIMVFRKIRPVFVQAGHSIFKIVIVMLIYASALSFMLKFNDKMSDSIERLTILLTSVTPIILQWKFKTMCPKRKLAEHIIREYAKEAERKGFDFHDRLHVYVV